MYFDDMAAIPLLNAGLHFHYQLNLPTIPKLWPSFGHSNLSQN
jgi:hypothetical protein